MLCRRSANLVAALEQAILPPAEFVRDKGGHEIDGHHLFGLRLAQPGVEDGGHAGKTQLPERAIEFDEIHDGSPGMRFERRGQSESPGLPLPTRSDHPEPGAARIGPQPRILPAKTTGSRGVDRGRSGLLARAGGRPAGRVRWQGPGRVLSLDQRGVVLRPGPLGAV